MSTRQLAQEEFNRVLAETGDARAANLAAQRVAAENTARVNQQTRDTINADRYNRAEPITQATLLEKDPVIQELAERRIIDSSSVDAFSSTSKCFLSIVWTIW